MSIVRGLFTPEEVAFYREHYMALRGEGRFPRRLCRRGSDQRRPAQALPAHDPYASLGRYQPAMADRRASERSA